MRKRNVLGIALGLLLIAQSAGAFSLQLPFQTKEQAWNESVKRYEGVPFKHRTYGDLEAEVMRVVDGDTLYVKMPSVHPLIGYEIGVRIYGIDTRELNDGGASSKEFAITLLPPGKRITLRNIRRGKYFRIVADVIVDGQSVSEILLEKGLAYPYYGGTKRPLGWKPEDYESDTEEGND